MQNGILFYVMAYVIKGGNLDSKKNGIFAPCFNINLNAKQNPFLCYGLCYKM
jgi:hypothetical protein